MAYVEADGYIFAATFIGPLTAPEFLLELVPCPRDVRLRHTASHVFEFLRAEDEKQAIFAFQDFMSLADKRVSMNARGDVILSVAATSWSPALEICLICPALSEIDALRTTGMAQDQKKEALAGLMALSTGDRQEIHENICSMLHGSSAAADEEMAAMAGGLADALDRVAFMEAQILDARAREQRAIREREEAISAYDRLRNNPMAMAHEWERKYDEARAECDRLRGRLREAIWSPNSPRSLQLFDHAQAGSAQAQAIIDMFVGTPFEPAATKDTRYMIDVSPVLPDRYRVMTIFRIEDRGHLQLKQLMLSDALVDRVFKWQSHGAAAAINAIVGLSGLQARVIRGEILGSHHEPDAARLSLLLQEGEPRALEPGKKKNEVIIARRVTSAGYKLFYE